MPETSVREIEEKLIEEVATILSVDPETIAVDSPFQSLGMDSMAFVELLVSIERVFDLQLMETDLSKEDFETVAALALRISRMR
jgi:acyl carrier protein